MQLDQGKTPNVASDLSSLFARYARHGDPGDLAEVFDRTAPNLLRLALHLTSCEADAEDLLQATFLTAIEIAARFDANRALLPWLCGILVNHARRLARRSTKLQIMTEGAVNVDPADSVMATETSMALKASIERLHPLYGEPIRMRLLEGMSTVAIARELNRSPGTVRVQIHRGLEQLRRMLPRSLAVSGAIMLVHGQGFAAVRRAVLERATKHAGKSSLAVAALLGLKKLGLLASATAGVLTIWILWPAHDRGWTDLHRETLVSGADYDEIATGSDEYRARRQPRSRSVITTTSLRAHGSLSVALRWQVDGLPAAGVLVRLDPQDGRDPRFHSMEVRANVDGIAFFDDVVPGLARIHVDRGITESKEVQAGQHATLNIALPSGVNIEGVVVSATGQPVAGAKVFLGQQTDPANSITSVLKHATITDAFGQFRIRGVCVHGSLSARAAGHAPSKLHYLSGVVPPDEKLKMVLSLGGSGVDLRGQVVDEQARPVSEALVSIGSRLPRSPFRLPDGTGVQHWHTYYLRTDRNGRFLAQGVLPGETQVTIRSEPHAPYMKRIEVSENLLGEQRYVIAPGALVAGVVQDEQGRPIAGAAVVTPKRLQQLCVSTEFMRTRTDGRFLLGGLQPGNAEITVHCRGFQAATKKLLLEPNQLREWNPVLVEQPCVSGRVVDPDGVGIPNVLVMANPTSWHRVRVAANDDFVDVTDQTGHFRISVISSLGYRLALKTECSLVRLSCDSVGVVKGGGEPVTITLTERQRATASVRGIARDHLGRPLRSAAVYIDGRRHLGGLGLTHPVNGQFQLRLLPPGRYTFKFQGRQPGQQPFTVGPVDLLTNQTVDLGDVGPGPGGDLLFSCQCQSGKIIRHITAILVPQGEGITKLLCYVPGKAIRHRLAPGTYQLQAWGQGFTSIKGYPVTIEENKTTPLRLLLQPGVRQRLVFLLPKPPNWDPDSRARIVLRRASDRSVIDEASVTVRVDRPITYSPTVAVGRYILEVETNNRHFEGAFQITSLDQKPNLLNVSLDRMHRERPSAGSR